MHALPELAAQTGAERNGSLAITITQAVGRFQSLPPALRSPAVHRQLTLVTLESGRLNPDQTNSPAPLPVSVKQPARFLDEVDVQLRRRSERMRAGDSREIRIAQFQLDGP